MRGLAGTLLVLLSAVSFGFLGLFRYWAVDGGGNTPTVLALRFWIGGVILWALVLAGRHRIRGGGTGVRLLPRGWRLGALVAMGAFLYFGQSLCFFTAMDFGVPTGLVSLLLYLYPGIVTLFSRLLFHEPLTPARLTALAIAMAGSVLTVGPVEGISGVGLALGIGSAVLYSMYILTGTRAMKDAAALPASAVVVTSAACSYTALALVHGPQLPRTAMGWAGIAGLAVVATVVAILAFLAGLARIGPVRTSTLSTCEAATTVAVGWALLGETLSPVQAAGGAMILAAAVITARASSAAPQDTAADLPDRRDADARHG